MLAGHTVGVLYERNETAALHPDHRLRDLLLAGYQLQIAIGRAGALQSGSGGGILPEASSVLVGGSLVRNVRLLAGPSILASAIEA